MKGNSFNKSQHFFKCCFIYKNPCKMRKLPIFTHWIFKENRIVNSASVIRVLTICYSTLLKKGGKALKMYN